MSRIQTYQVLPNIPSELEFLEILSRNLWWCWKKDAIELFRRIDLRLWQESARNPLRFLSAVSQERLEELAQDNSFLAQQQKVREGFESSMGRSLIFQDLPFADNETIAYFSMEFGLHESIPLFAGGLGILAGDHLKAASNLGLPLTGIGLLYREGYFYQLLNSEGQQREEYPVTDYFHLPIERAQDPEGNEVRVSVAGPFGDIQAEVWLIQVGRVSLYLLDTNLQENPPEIRDITARLYAGGAKIRLAQEALLGIGGMRALAAMGIFPKVCHMNEGHSAFCSLERLAQIMESQGASLKTALEIIPRATIFTTHTPVAAGHDEFAVELVKPVLEPFAERLGTSLDEILSWGQLEDAEADMPLSMFILGMHMAQHCNGVSELHGRTARRMWSHIWPKRHEDEVPISHITNGVHISSFISMEFASLFDRYLGPEWYLKPHSKENIERIDDIYDEDLWRAHELNRARLIRTCRQQLVKQYQRRNAPQAATEEAETVLDNDALTIGFARRFATYKRADLLLKDPDRLEAILNSATHPVQIVFAGKAHPKDNEGKELIKQIFQFARRANIRKRIVFLENYDMHLARHLVQGVDVWLNTPRRPFEACGTSGMKAALNGALNVSILDGWWCEGYTAETGWAIGHGEENRDHEYQDAVESQALYNILENDVIPCFYDRKNGDLSSCWVAKMKASIKMIMAQFDSQRMVEDYLKRYYIPAAKRADELMADSQREAMQLADQTQRLRDLWQHIHVEAPVCELRGAFRVGDRIQISARVHLGELQPEEVDVELYYGLMQSVDIMRSSQTIGLEVKETHANGSYLYGGTVVCQESGRFGYTVRVTPRGDGRIKSTPKLITWA